MSTPNKYAPEANVLPPRCPHCATDLGEVGTYQWSKQIAIGVVMMLCIYCPNSECRKTLGTQILVVPLAQEGSSIVKPS